MYNYFMCREAFQYVCANNILVRIYGISHDYVHSSQDVLRARVRATGMHMIRVGLRRYISTYTSISIYEFIYLSICRVIRLSIYYLCT